MNSFKKHLGSRWSWALVLIATMVLTGFAGYGSARLGAQIGVCPTDDSCYRQTCWLACKTNACDAGPDCPDPGNKGSRCYVCANPW